MDIYKKNHGIVASKYNIYMSIVKLFFKPIGTCAKVGDRYYIKLDLIGKNHVTDIRVALHHETTGRIGAWNIKDYFDFWIELFTAQINIISKIEADIKEAIRHHEEERLNYAIDKVVKQKNQTEYEKEY